MNNGYGDARCFKDLGECPRGREDDGHIKAGPVNISQKGKDSNLGSSQIRAMIKNGNFDPSFGVILMLSLRAGSRCQQTIRIEC